MPAGSTRTVTLPISHLSTRTPVGLEVRAVQGAKPGPVLFLSAAIHGDEIIGVEIIRRVLNRINPRTLAGTLLCVPIVNVFGFISHSRYLPDRRDLNRSFPGLQSGSLASQLANTFVKEIIERSDFGIDIHSAGMHRSNLSQIRINEDAKIAEEMALDFHPPVILQAPLRDGSLRGTARELGVEVLLFETGEALRFDETAIRIGVNGILGVMAGRGMMPVRTRKTKLADPVRSDQTHWVRAPQGGLFRAVKSNGARVRKGDALGYLADPFGDDETPVVTPYEGIIIGRSNLPVVNQGDALMHVAEVMRVKTAEGRIEDIQEAHCSDPLFDEDEII